MNKYMLLILASAILPLYSAGTAVIIHNGQIIINDKDKRGHGQLIVIQGNKGHEEEPEKEVVYKYVPVPMKMPPPMPMKMPPPMPIKYMAMPQAHQPVRLHQARYMAARPLIPVEGEVLQAMKGMVVQHAMGHTLNGATPSHVW